MVAYWHFKQTAAKSNVRKQKYGSLFFLLGTVSQKVEVGEGARDCSAKRSRCEM